MRPSSQVCNLRRIVDELAHKAYLINKVQKCASPYDFHRWRTPQIHDEWQKFTKQVLLTRVPGTLHHQIMMVKVSQEFWRILCQIRIIKYCAEPSVRGLPEYEGCLRLGNKFKRSLNQSRFFLPISSRQRVSSRLLYQNITSTYKITMSKTTLLPNEVHKEALRFNTT